MSDSSIPKQESSEQETAEKRIIVDEDWKSQVQAEKEAAAAEKEKAESATSGDDSDASDEAKPEPATDSAQQQATAEADPSSTPFPPANFISIISMLTSQAMVAMGHMPHPATGQAQPNLNEAKYLVDLIAMLEEKTKGNLTDEEKKMMDEVLHQLRLGFVAAQNQPK